MLPATSLRLYCFDITDEQERDRPTFYLHGRQDQTNESCSVRVTGLYEHCFVVFPGATEGRPEELDQFHERIASILYEHAAIKSISTKVSHRRIPKGGRFHKIPIEFKSFVPGQRVSGLVVRTPLLPCKLGRVAHVLRDHKFWVLEDDVEPLETFLAWQGVHCPGWITITNARLVKKEDRRTWARNEFCCEDASNVESGHTTSTTLGLPTFEHEPALPHVCAIRVTRSSDDTPVVLGVSLCFRDVSSNNIQTIVFVLGQKGCEPTFRKVNDHEQRIFPTEATLLLEVSKSIQTEVDPDVWVGHHVHEDLKLLARRLRLLPNGRPSVLGRIRNTERLRPKWQWVNEKNGTSTPRRRRYLEDEVCGGR